MPLETHTSWLVNDMMDGVIGKNQLLEYNYEDIYSNLPNEIKVNLQEGEFYAEAEKLIKAELGKGEPSVKPFLLHMGGVPGSGKTYALERMDLSGVILIQFDGIMEKFSLYKQAIEKADKNNKNELVEIFETWEMPARVIAWELAGRALKGKYPLAIDSAGHSKEQYSLLTNMQKQGTKVGMYHIHISIEDALKRAHQRMLKTGRPIPKGMIEKRYALLEKLTPEYAEELGVFFDLEAQHDENGNPTTPKLKNVFLNGVKQEPPFPNIIDILKGNEKQ